MTNETKNEDEIYKMEEPTAPSFFEHVHDEFISMLADQAKNDFGIEIYNIRIENLKISDANLQQKISQQAIEVSKLHTQYLMLQKKQEITKVQAETEAAKRFIESNAINSINKKNAQTDAESMIIRAEGKKKARILEGEAEMEYSKRLDNTSLGRELAKMNIQAQAIKGISQIAYIPQLPKLFDRGIFQTNQFIDIPNIANKKNKNDNS